MTTQETPRPEAPPYAWPNHDLKNLVMLAPMSPYTRALLRIKFNCPVPEECQTFEQIEAWLATLPVPTWRRPSPPPLPALPRRPYVTDEDCLDVEAKICGSNYYYKEWEKRGTVSVPLSIWEQGQNRVEEYVDNELSGYDEDEYDHLEFAYTGDDEDFEFEDDIERLMAQAQEMIEARDAEDEEE